MTETDVEKKKETGEKKETAIVKKDYDKIIKMESGRKLIAHKVPLYEDRDEFYELKTWKPREGTGGNTGKAIKFDAVSKLSPTAVGYDKLNKISGLTLITPNIVTFGDKQMPNPYVIRTDDTRQVEEVIVRKIAFGRAPTGGLVSRDYTFSFNLNAHFTKSLLGLVQSSKGNVARMVNQKELKPEETVGKYYHPMLLGMSIEVDMNHEDAIKKWKEFADQQSFATRKAGTIAERNAMRKHPLMAILIINAEPETKAPHRVCKVEVQGWIETPEGKSEISVAAQKLEKNLQPDNVDTVVSKESNVDDETPSDEVVEQPTEDASFTDLPTETSIPVEEPEPTPEPEPEQLAEKEPTGEKTKELDLNDDKIEEETEPQGVDAEINDIMSKIGVETAVEIKMDLFGLDVIELTEDQKVEYHAALKSKQQELQKDDTEEPDDAHQ